MRILFLVLLVFPHTVFARPERLSGGPARFRMHVAKDDLSRIQHDRARLGDTFEIIVSFDAPEADSRAELHLRPINGEILAGSQMPDSSSDSTLRPGTKVIRDFGTWAPGSRVRFRVPFTALGKNGSQLQAELRVIGENPSVGRSVLTFSTEPDGRIARKKSRLLRQALRQKLQSEGKTQLRANKVLPFDPSKFEAAMKTPSRVVTLPAGGGR